MSESELSYVRSFSKKLEGLERKLFLLDDFLVYEKNKGIILKGPLYYTQGLNPVENGRTDIGNVDHFVKDLYINGKIVYPDTLNFGINNDLTIDKMGKVSFHHEKGFDGVSLFGLPSFKIQNVLYLGDKTLFFQIDGDIKDYLSVEDIFKINGQEYRVLLCQKDKIQFESISGEVNLQVNQEYELAIYSNILGCYQHSGQNILRMNARGDIFYKTNDRKSEINIGGNVSFQKKVVVENLLVNNLSIENDNLVSNLNAEYLGSKKAPQLGEIVSTKDNQILWNKSFGDTLGMNKNRIMDMADPLYDLDAVTKRYVDRYLSGLKVRRSCKCATVKNLDCDYRENKLYFKDNFELYSNDAKSLFDNYSLKVNESVLVFNQTNKNENGVYVIISDGMESGRICLERRYDLTEKTEMDDLLGFYTFVENGEFYGGLGFVLEGEVNSAINFHIFSKIEGLHEGRGIIRENNTFNLNVNPNIFKVEEKLNLREKSLSNKFLEHTGFHFVGLSGLDIDKSLVSLGDKIQLGLKIDPNQFYFGKDGELKYKLRINENIKYDLNGISSLQNVHQLLPPENLFVHLQYSDDFHELEKNEVVQYFVSALNGDGNETQVISSNEFFYSSNCKSIFSKINFPAVRNAEGYKIYRKINNNYWFHKLIQNEIIDVIIPENFSKIPWIPCSAPNHQNNTVIVVNRFATLGHNFITSGNLGLGTLKPSELLSLKDGKILIERNDKNDFLHLSLKGIYGERCRIIGETNAGVGVVELGREIKMYCDDEGSFYLGKSENCDDKNFNEEIGSNEMTLQVKDGGAYIEGDVLLKEGRSFGCYNNKLGNNAGIIRTGCLSNSIGNEVSFMWEGDELKAVPLHDGNILTRKKVNVKNFVVQHPKVQNRYLAHACLEGPTADVFYRGKGEIQYGYAQVQLPDYFKALIVEGSATLLLTCCGKPFSLGGEVIEEENLVNVYGEDGWFYWEVKAERKDTHFEVEPLKNEVEIKSFGPYCYFS